MMLLTSLFFILTAASKCWGDIIVCDCTGSEIWSSTSCFVPSRPSATDALILRGICELILDANVVVDSVSVEATFSAAAVLTVGTGYMLSFRTGSVQKNAIVQLDMSSLNFSSVLTVDGSIQCDSCHVWGGGLLSVSTLGLLTVQKSQSDFTVGQVTKFLCDVSNSGNILWAAESTLVQKWTNDGVLKFSDVLSLKYCHSFFVSRKEGLNGEQMLPIWAKLHTDELRRNIYFHHHFFCLSPCHSQCK